MITSTSVLATTTYPGGGVHNFGQNWFLISSRQYSSYNHERLYHRSSVYQNGCYYYSGGSRNMWYSPNTWAIAKGPWTINLWEYNSYWSTR